MVGEHKPVDERDEERLDLKLGFVILAVGSLNSDDDDGHCGLTIQETAEQGEIVRVAAGEGFKGATSSSVMFVVGMAVVCVAVACWLRLSAPDASPDCRRP